MENNNEKIEKLEVKSLRLSPSVDAKIKELAGDYGNVNGFIEYLLTLNEKENNAIKYPDFKANIEAFSVLLSKLDKSFMSIIETGANAAQFAKEEVSKELENNQNIIADLITKNKDLSATVDKLEGSLSQIKIEKDNLTIENTRLSDLNNKNEEIAESKKNEVLTLSGELSKYKKYADENITLSEENREFKDLINKLNSDLNKVKSDIELKDKEIAADKIKEEELKNQITELKAEIKVYKGNIKDLEKENKAEIKALEKAHKDEITRLNEMFNTKLEREIERVTTAATKEVELQNREFKLKEEQLKFNTNKLQEKLNETSIVLDATKQELQQVKAKNKQKGKAAEDN